MTVKFFPDEDSQGASRPPSAFSTGTLTGAASARSPRKVRQVYDICKAQQDVTHQHSLKVHADKPRLAWAADHSPVWLANSFLAPADRFLLGEAARFPPNFIEDPPDRSLRPRRVQVALLDRQSEEESRRLSLPHHDDFTELPRRRRIQLLESMLDPDEEAALPPHRKPEELQNVRQVSTARARREFAIRWGALHAAHLSKRRPSAESPESPGSTHAGEFELLEPSTAPREIFPEPVQAPRWTAAELEILERPKLEPAESWWEQKRNQEEEEFRSSKTASLIKELAAGVECTEVSVAHATRLARLGQAIEGRTFKLRPEQLCQALQLLGRAVSLMQASAEVRVTDRLELREHWRRAHQDLGVSAQTLAAAASASAMKSSLPRLVAAFQAMAASGTCCQERLDAQLARLKELFGVKFRAPQLAILAGALGAALLPGPPGKGVADARKGATPQSAARNPRILKEFIALLVEHLAEFSEEEFHTAGWVFPTAYLSDAQLRQFFARAAEIQVGLRAESQHCRGIMCRIADFFADQPKLFGSLSEFLQLYCSQLRGHEFKRSASRVSRSPTRAKTLKL